MKTLLLITVLALSGCAIAPGVQMDDAEKQACKAETCTVWTPKELNGLARELFRKGYEAGVKSI